MSIAKKALMALSFIFPITGVVGLLLYFLKFSGTALNGQFIRIFILTVIAAILIMLSVYSSNVRKNPRLNEEQKRRWMMSFSFFSFVSVPVYWWLYVKKDI